MSTLTAHRRLEDISGLPEPLGALDYFFVEERLFSIVHDQPGIWVVQTHSSRGNLSAVGRVINRDGEFIADSRAAGGPVGRESLHDAIRALVIAAS